MPFRSAYRPFWLGLGTVAFDLLLLALMGTLLVRWRPRVATLLATLTSADVVLTSLQGLLYNLPAHTGVVDGVAATAGLDADDAGHSCVLLDVGAAVCWAAGVEGQLGHGFYQDESTPVTVLFP